MASVSILCIVVMAKIWFDKKRFNFLIWICAIILVTDIGIAMLVVALKLENSPLRVTKNIELAIVIGITNFLFVGGSALYHWIFCFKYWVISLEFAKVLNNEEIESIQLCYNIYNTIGIVSSLIMSIWLGVARGQLAAKIDEPVPAEGLVRELTYCYFAAIIFGLISGALFADALRRIKILLKQMPHLVVNQLSFRLYIFVLVSHSITNSVCLFIINWGFNKTSPEALKIQIYSRIVLFSTLWFLQIILLIIFYRWTGVRHDKRITIDLLNISKNFDRDILTTNSNSSLNRFIEEENEEANDRVKKVA
jgi:hypothetical protein